MGQRKKEVDLEAVQRLAARGLTEGEMAKALGISADTLTARKHDQAGVVEAIAKGRRQAVGAVENAMFEAALKAANDHRYQTSAIFWLKCRAGWKERQVVEVKDEREQVRRDGLISQIERITGRAGGEPAEA